MVISKNISRDHVLLAIAEIRKGGIPNGRESKRFLLEHEGIFYPPKYVISRANFYANGSDLNPKKFHGGDESNRFLMSLGFKIAVYKWVN
jgi:5-methylcytosine-specific restriction protein B